MTTQPLKRCPCGQVPDWLHCVSECDEGPRWVVSCNYCRQWQIVFHPGEVDGHDAWNAAPRAKGLE